MAQIRGNSGARDGLMAWSGCEPRDWRMACIEVDHAMSTSNSNVIVLTSGLTGSSVLTGLIARAGYWTGSQTFKKEYDTFENVELIRLNRELFAAAGYSGRYEMEFRGDVLERLASPEFLVDDSAHRRFLEECGRHEPWIWKDPRLWLTIRYWNRLIDWNRVKVIVLTRDLRLSWVSMTLRRQIQSYGAMKEYELAIEHSIRQFLDSNRLGRLEVTFEDLIAKPAPTLGRLNEYLGVNLRIDDLKAVYRGELGRKPRGSIRDFATAALIYIKNRSQRWDLKEKRA